METELIEQLVNVNLMSAYFMTRLVLPSNFNFSKNTRDRSFNNSLHTHSYLFFIFPFISNDKKKKRFNFVHIKWCDFFTNIPIIYGLCIC